MPKAYKSLPVTDVPDISGDRPGEFRTTKKSLDTSQIAVTYRRMPAKTGGKGGKGHRHITQEEVVFVISGQVQVKVNDDVVELPANNLIRIDAGAAQATWNDGPDDAEILIISQHSDNVMDDVEWVADFWPMSS